MSELDPRAIIAREPMHFRQVIAIGIATALNSLDGFDVLSISFAAPGIARDWGIDRAALGLVLSMELIGMGIGALILGAMADRIGRRPVFIFGALGSPPADTTSWGHTVAGEAARFLRRLPHARPADFEAMFPGVGAAGAALLGQLLAYSPRRRARAGEALAGAPGRRV